MQNGSILGGLKAVNPVTPTQAAPISNAFEALFSDLDALGHAVESLAGRLSPVLNIKPQPPTNQGQSDTPTMSPVTERVVSARSAVLNILDRVRTLHDCLEL